jgi:predicted RNase H-like HicB family nuclease
MSRSKPTSRYRMSVFWSDDDQCWIADAPDLRFCSAHGDSPAKAVAELEIAMAAWLETARERQTPIPRPRYRPALAG